MATVGYDAEWHCIPASAVGAPHQRDRIWIAAADAGGEQHEGCRNALGRTGTAELHGPVADAATLLRATILGNEPDRVAASGGAVADTDSVPWHERRARYATQGAGGRYVDRGGGSEDVCNTDRQGLAVGKGVGSDTREEFAPSLGADWWAVEPDVGRVADGVPSRVDRLRCLGNAVVPQIPELIGRAILKAEGLAA
jgi:DNA (cytosine-5)-methyltransferase 1